jgi:DNA-binding transcriptional ArsR family regulator
VSRRIVCRDDADRQDLHAILPAVSQGGQFQFVNNTWPMSASWLAPTIYRALVRAGEAGMPVGRLQDKLKIAPSTLSHHVKALVVAGLSLR